MATKQSGSKTQNNSGAFHILGDTLESAAETFEEATTNARASATRAAGVAKSALGTALCKTCYGLSYGAVYSAVFLVELLPEGGKVRKAFTDGAEAALADRKKALEQQGRQAPEGKAHREVEAPCKQTGKSSRRRFRRRCRRRLTRSANAVPAAAVCREGWTTHTRDLCCPRDFHYANSSEIFGSGSGVGICAGGAEARLIAKSFRS